MFNVTITDNLSAIKLGLQEYLFTNITVYHNIWLTVFAKLYAHKEHKKVSNRKSTVKVTQAVALY